MAGTTTAHIPGIGSVFFSKCWKCGAWWGMTEDLHALARQRGSDLTVYCPNGHGGVFMPYDTEADKLRRERDQLTQRLAEKDDEIARQRDRAEREERRVSAAKGQITRLKNRASHGVCPCCNRTFADLARHMAGKHPGYMSEPTADAHVN